jgi:hypothetical protein
VYLLYLDESGNENDPADMHFVLAGAAIFERQAYWLSRTIDDMQERHFPGKPPITFHAASIRAGKGFWRRIKPTVREAVLKDISQAIANAPPLDLALFGAAIQKTDRLYGEEAVKRAAQQVCQRFDLLLARHYHEFNNPQRGLLIFSEGNYDKRVKVWVKEFRELGTEFGSIRNFADVPFFASMPDTRLLQIADYIAHALFLLYERKCPDYIREIIGRFDQKDGILHGLVHYTPRGTKDCDCPACASRRTPSDFGSWL